jgi:hypothetical protein
VKTAVYNFILFFCNYKNDNEALINKLLDGNPDVNFPGFKTIKENFQINFINKVKSVMPIIDSGLTGIVHDLFSPLLNHTAKDSSTINSSDFNLFSWMNCSAIGQDYNATLSTLKSNLTNEMRVITYCSLTCELLLIATLYIMVGLAKNLRDKIFEINDARNVSHTSDNIEEIQVNSIKETKNDKEDDEIFAIKNKKKFEVVENIDQKRGIDVNEGLDKDGNGITHPAVVSINGPDGRCIFQNGENGEDAHIELEKNKKMKDLKDKETNENSMIKSNKVNVEKKNLPNKKKIILDSEDEEKSDKNDDESSRKAKKTKNNAKSNKNIPKLKSSKSIAKKDKKSSGTVSSSSVSFG